MQIELTELNNHLINKSYIIGCDECGTGALAGNFLVCGIKAPKDWTHPGLNDSKKVSAKKRNKIAQELTYLALEEHQISYYIAERSNVQIDEFGLAACLKSAYVEIFNALYDDDSLIVCDGMLKFDGFGIDHYDKVSMIKADAKVPAVMAASILGKSTRDDLMHELHSQYPQFDFASNVGYGTAKHLAAIKQFGLSEIHRKSYNIKG